MGVGGDGVGNLDPDQDQRQRRRALTLSLWRDYLCLLSRLSPEDAAARRASAAAEIRKATAADQEKRSKNDTDDTTDPDAGVKRLMAAVSFLRATTSRSPGEKKRLSGGSSGGRGVFVVRKGELVRVEGGGDETTRYEKRESFFFFKFIKTLLPLHSLTFLTLPSPNANPQQVDAGREAEPGRGVPEAPRADAAAVLRPRAAEGRRGAVLMV